MALKHDLKLQGGLCVDPKHPLNPDQIRALAFLGMDVLVKRRIEIISGRLCGREFSKKAIDSLVYFVFLNGFLKRS